MSDIERQIRETLDRVAASATARNRLSEIASPRRRRLSTLALALAAFVVIVSVGAVSLLLASRTPDSVGVGADTTIPGDQSPIQSGLLPPGVEVEVSSAVAPFDYESHVDSLLLSSLLVRALNQQVSDCLAEEGFTPIEMGPMPDRDNHDRAAWWSPDFPDVETLSRDGFPDWGTDYSTDDYRERSDEESAAGRRCLGEVHGADSAATRAYSLWGDMFGAWQRVLEEIEATDEVRSRVDEFGACLRSEGIPEESATWDRFLGYAQSLLMAAADDSAFLESNQRMGKLFAECGRELFETRAQLRGGERRTAFLTEHAESIHELSTLLTTPVVTSPTVAGTTDTTMPAPTTDPPGTRRLAQVQPILGVYEGQWRIIDQPHSGPFRVTISVDETDMTLSMLFEFEGNALGHGPLEPVLIMSDLTTPGYQMMLWAEHMGDYESDFHPDFSYRAFTDRMPGYDYWFNFGGSVFTGPDGERVVGGVYLLATYPPGEFEATRVDASQGDSG